MIKLTLMFELEGETLKLEIWVLDCGMLLIIWFCKSDEIFPKETSVLLTCANSTDPTTVPPMELTGMSKVLSGLIGTVLDDCMGMADGSSGFLGT